MEIIIIINELKKQSTIEIYGNFSSICEGCGN